MNKGKQNCRQLKALRKAIADANGITYNPRECTHQGDCPGTCPLCDWELKCINDALDEKRRRGEAVIVPRVEVEKRKLAPFAKAVAAISLGVLAATASSCGPKSSGDGGGELAGDVMPTDSIEEVGDDELLVGDFDEPIDTVEEIAPQAPPMVLDIV